jgi:group I intron endonuclease
MIFLYEGASEMPSIYEIRNRQTNRSYIGQTVEPKNRWSGHKSSLVRGIHNNGFLQADYNKCLAALGHDNFLEFHIIERLPESTQEKRNQRELYWMRQYTKRGYKLYNLVLESGGVYIKSEETKKKMRNALLGRQLSEEHKAKISANAKNNPNYGLKGKHQSEAAKKKISEGRLGEKHWHYGKKLSQDRLDKLKATYNVRLISPDGEVYDQVFGLTDFAKTHGLSLAGLRFLVTGERKTHKGWKRADDPVIEIDMDPKTKQCSKCKQEKSLSLFNRKTESKDGRRANCRVCQKLYSRTKDKPNTWQKVR